VPICVKETRRHLRMQSLFDITGSLSPIGTSYVRGVKVLVRMRKLGVAAAGVIVNGTNRRDHGAHLGTGMCS